MYRDDEDAYPDAHDGTTGVRRYVHGGPGRGCQDTQKGVYGGDWGSSVIDDDGWTIRSERDAMIAEVVVDAHHKEEALMGFFDRIGDSLSVPFTTTILAMAATVEAISQSTDGSLVAVCSRGR